MNRLSVVPLRSGSSGNMTLVEHAGTSLLVDAGIPSQKRLSLALSECGRSWDDIDAVLVSHLHADHIHAAGAVCCARHGVPILLHERNVRAFSRRVLSRAPAAAPVRAFGLEPFSVGTILVRPFAVPHDAEGVTCGFIFSAPAATGEARVAMATDLGHGGNGLFEEFVDSDLILIESNYDPATLSRSARHDKARVDSDMGHLSNEQAGRFLARVMTASRRPPRAVILCHLSADHNTPSRATATVREILSRHGFGHVPVHAARRNSSLPRFFAVDEEGGYNR
ncbi:MAG: MBL fold metallo-hydrolase [Deltaproteobacteria bacterium]|nr:MBL fold metallo-hydrolase [Deltaproteobacteria bacterium]